MANTMTPLEDQPKLAAAIGLSGLSLKREDLHPYGSHKGRSIPLMIDRYYQNGDRRFAISSSGNAALAAVMHAQKLNAEGKVLELDVFVGNHAAPHKVEKLKRFAGEHIRILVKERPLQALTQTSQEGIRSLRQSTDDSALIGYGSLAEELAKAKGVGAVFIGTSSGTTAQALAEYFLGKKLPIQVHIVQTSSCHPMAEAFESYDGPDEPSIADAIVDKTAYRKDKLVPLIEKTGGRGWSATNDDIRAAQELAKKHAGLDISTNSALSVAGAMKAAVLGYKIKGTVVCLICGD